MFACIILSKHFLGPLIASQIISLVLLIFIGCISYPILSFLFFYKHTTEQLAQIKDMFFKNGKLKLFIQKESKVELKPSLQTEVQVHIRLTREV
jgi:hypothetical protein